MGKGFITDNITSFKTFLSEYKKDKFGSKGMGRLSYLYLYRNVNIESETLIENQPQKVNIKFDIHDWVLEETKNIDYQNIAEFKTYTKLKLSGYRRERKGSPINLEKTAEHLRSELLPLIILTPGIKISISYPAKEEFYEISNDDIPVNISTEIVTVDSIEISIRMAISDSEKSICEAHYIAGYRTAGKITKIKAIPNYALYCLAESTFFEEHVNDDRDRILFPTVEQNGNLFLSEEKIETEIYKVLQKYIQNNKPQIIENSNNARKKVIELEPYLNDYIPNDPLLNEKDLRTEGQKNYQKDKEELRTIREHLKIQTESQQLEDAELEQYLDKAIEIGTKVLAEYINDRHSIINILKQLHLDEERVEKKLHNLFMLQKSSDLIDSAENYISTKENNLWLIDDRFMTYKYVASDLRIKDILSQMQPINTDNSQDRPDLSIFLSEQNITDKAVIVELKPYGISSYDKEKGIQQLLKYAEIFKENLSSTQQWYYLITDIDDEFKKLLRRNQYQEVFTHGDVMYFNYNKELDTHIYVLSYKSLIADAEARNQIFLDQFIKNIPQ